ncbi:trans-sialidase [Trypanosoma cruzi]|nr:trans-sialidase [Trypanosoma cruzi]
MCASRVTWGQRGRRLSEHSRAFGSGHDQDSVGTKACVWMPSSPRPLREGHALHSERIRLGGNATALYLWATDNNRSFYFGPVAVEEATKWEFASALLYSDGSLHLLQAKGDHEKGSAIPLARLTEELNTINSVLSTWARLDASFSESSTPTAGLVGFLSNAASEHKLIDD